MDTTFGNNGVLRIARPTFSVAPFPKVQPDGKLLLLTSDSPPYPSPDWQLSRYNRDGTPDSDFVSAPVQFDVASTVIPDILVAPNGSILVGGYLSQPIPTLFVARFLSNGSLDPSYGSGGIALLPQTQVMILGSLALQSDGSVILLEGFAQTEPLSARHAFSQIQRITPAGSVDAAFGVRAPCGGIGGDSVAVRADDKVLFSGSDVGFTSQDPPIGHCVARLNPDGEPDPTFGAGGSVLLGSDDAIVRLTLDSGNHILTGGFSGDSSVAPQLVRLLPSGAIDSAFGSLPDHRAAILTTQLSLSCADKLIGAFSTNPGGNPIDHTYLVRYNSNGTADATFGIDASGTVAIGPTAVEFWSLVRSDGDILVATRDLTPGSWDVLITAYHQADCTSPNDTQADTVIEYYNASLDHYFITGSVDDVGVLDSGHFTGWSRTGYTFSAGAPTSSLSSVCRYYIPPLWGDSHFFSASAAECDDVRTRFPQFVLETPDAMRVGLPDAQTGNCAEPTSAQIYRVWDNRADTNHRYVTDRSLRDSMVSKGWIAEGYGPDAVAMCARPQ